MGDNARRKCVLPPSILRDLKAIVWGTPRKVGGVGVEPAASPSNKTVNGVDNNISKVVAGTMGVEKSLAVRGFIFACGKR